MYFTLIQSYWSNARRLSVQIWLKIKFTMQTLLFLYLNRTSTVKLDVISFIDSIFWIPNSMITEVVFLQGIWLSNMTKYLEIQQNTMNRKKCEKRVTEIERTKYSQFRRNRILIVWRSENLFDILRDIIVNCFTEIDNILELSSFKFIYSFVCQSVRFLFSFPSRTIC